MPWVRRGYDPRFDGPYGYGQWGRRPRYGPGNSCLRDACLLETGCCVAEALDGNCLVTGLLLLPQFAGVALSASRGRPGHQGRTGHADHADRTGHTGHTGRTGRTGRRGAAAMVAAIRLYQREISAHRQACCRFSPSCSQYAVEAIETHGAVRGALLAARRLVRCRPGGARGADPVPA